MKHSVHITYSRHTHDNIYSQKKRVRKHGPITGRNTVFRLHTTDIHMTTYTVSRHELANMVQSLDVTQCVDYIQQTYT